MSKLFYKRVIACRKVLQVLVLLLCLYLVHVHVWRPLTPDPPDGYTHNEKRILESSQLNNKLYIQNLTGYNDVNCSAGIPCRYPDTADLRIIVLTYNRAESLRVLLESVRLIELDGDRAAVEIWVDRNEQNVADIPTLRVSSEFCSSRPACRVHVQTRHVGIYGQWINTWSPTNTSKHSMELALVLEDDMIVSRYSYRWLKAVHTHYRHHEEFFGATLDSDPTGPQNNKPRLFSNPRVTAYWYAFSGTWGPSPSPHQWHRFQTWYHRTREMTPDFKPYIPNSVITEWYKSFELQGKGHEMWSIWLAYYMYRERLFAIRNNLDVYNGDGRSCLSINRKMAGLHFSGSLIQNGCSLLDVWRKDFVAFPLITPKLDLNANLITSNHSKVTAN